MCKIWRCTICVYMYFSIHSQAQGVEPQISITFMAYTLFVIHVMCIPLTSSICMKYIYIWFTWYMYLRFMVQCIYICSTSYMCDINMRQMCTMGVYMYSSKYSHAQRSSLWFVIYVSIIAVCLFTWCMYSSLHRDCHSISISNLNLQSQSPISISNLNLQYQSIGLCSTEHDKRDIEN